MIMPPFCPNPECRYHYTENRTRYERRWFYKIGLLTTEKNSNPIQRFKCSHCGKKFCENTFSVHYYAKKTIDLPDLHKALASGMSIRSMGRFFRCSPNTIMRKIDTLSRQSIAVLSAVLFSMELKEDLTADGFESFVGSQYYPNNFNILVGKKSQYMYFFNYLQLNRKGRMTEYQKKKATELKKEWHLIENQQKIQFNELLRVIKEFGIRQPGLDSVNLYTDEKIEYKQCIDEGYMPVELSGSRFRINHIRISSFKHRDLRNELYASNYTDRELRKDLAEHRRETACFARNVNNSLGRASVYFVHHNFIKNYRINQKNVEKTSHADAAGIDRKLYSSLMAHFYTRRFFISHLNLSGHWERLWCKAYQTPLKRVASYVPAYALM